jgi:hypothetical protein
MSKVEVIFSAADQASPVVDKLNDKLGVTGEQLSEVDKSTKPAGMSMTDFSSAVNMAEKALSYIKMGLEQTVGVMVSYADEVRGLQQVTGASAEETSRLIQVIDDYKVSTNSAMLAQRSLTKEGIILTIDSLAKLSDEYLAIENQSDKNAFAQKNLGRSYADFTEILQQGSKAIKEQGAAVSGSLILTQKALDQARDYQFALDNWNDSVMALQVSIGTKMLPAMTQLLDSGQLNARAVEILKSANDNYSASMLASGRHMTESAKAALEQAKSELEASRATDAASQSASAAAASAEDLAAAQQAVSDANNNLISTIGTVQQAEEKYNQKVTSLTEDRIKIEGKRAEEIAKGWQTDQDKVAEYDAALLLNGEKVKENEAEHTLANRKIILGLLERKLTADGILDDNEIKWLLEKGKEWGIYSDKVISEARDAISEANGIAEAIHNIPNNKDVIVNIHAISDYYDNFSDRKADHASGGSFLIPESYGHEGFQLGNGDTASGGERITITPRGGGGGESGIDYNRMARVFRDAILQVSR